MNACSLLENIRVDLDAIVEKNSVPFTGTYEFSPDCKISLEIKLEASKDFLLTVSGPLGAQEANLKNLEKVINVATLYLSKQLSAAMSGLRLEPDQSSPNSGANEILALFKGLREFQKKTELPYTLMWKNGNAEYELFSVSVSDGSFKVSLETVHIHGKTVKHVTEIEEYDHVVERTHQFLLFELIAWLTPQSPKARQKTTVFTKLGMWVVPVLVAAVFSSGVGAALWYTNSYKPKEDWKKIASKAEYELVNGDRELGLKEYRRAIVIANSQDIPDSEKLALRKRFVFLARYNLDHKTFVEEASKFIAIADMLGEKEKVKRVIFEVAQKEFDEGNYQSVITQLSSLIPLLDKSGYKDFYIQIKSYVLLSRSYIMLEDYPPAKKLLNEALVMADETGFSKIPGVKGFINYDLGTIAEKEKNLEQAKAYYIEAVSYEKEILEANERISVLGKQFLESQPKEALKRIEGKLQMK